MPALEEFITAGHYSSPNTPLAYVYKIWQNNHNNKASQFILKQSTIKSFRDLTFCEFDLGQANLYQESCSVIKCVTLAFSHDPLFIKEKALQPFNMKPMTLKTIASLYFKKYDTTIQTISVNERTLLPDQSHPSSTEANIKS